MRKHRKVPEPEEIFLNGIKTLLKNLLITNVNYTNGYYARGFTWNTINELITDTQERAGYILERIEQTEHLVIDHEERY
jgi:hypothetical protein